MPALTTMLAVGAAALGTVTQVALQSKASKDAKSLAADQEMKAREAAKVRGPKEQDLKIKIGTGDGDAAAKGTAVADTGAAERVGGVFNKARRASAVGGL